MYEFNSRVRYSEIDHHGTLTLPALINIFRIAARSSQKMWDLERRY